MISFFLRPVSMHRFSFLFCLFALFLLTGCGLMDGSFDQGPRTRVTQLAVPLEIPPQVTDEGGQKAPERQVDFIVIQKRDWLMSLWKDGRILKTYSIMAMGARPVGHKVFEGDERTPEGTYYISDKHVSKNFQKFLQISYPNEQDKGAAQRYGVSAGGNVGIHGDRGGMSGFFQRFDKNWTDGCVALRNNDIEQVYAMVDIGTPIMIKP